MHNRFRQAVHAQRQSSEKFTATIPGTLGIPINGALTVEVPTRNGYVYVQLRNSSSEVIQAFNDQVAPSYGLPVFVEWQNNRYIVVGRDTLRYIDWQSQSSYMPRHGYTHEADPSGQGGGDVVFVYQRQFRPLMPTPSGTLAAKNILIGDYTLLSSTGNFGYYPQQATRDLTVWNPSTPTGAVFVLVSLNTADGTLRYDVGSGTIMPSSLTGSAQVIPYLPAAPAQPQYVPVVAVRLLSGTSTINWANLYDVRQMFSRGFGTPSAGSSQGLFVLNQGAPIGTGTSMNYTGDGVTASISGTTVQVNIPRYPITVQDEAVLLGTGSTFNFTGPNVTASISGSVVTVDVQGGGAGPAGPPGPFGVFAKDEGVSLGTGTTLNFTGAGLAATISGTTVTVNVPLTGRVLIQQFLPFSGAVSFLNIPQTYGKLTLEGVIRTDSTSSSLKVQFNGDTGTANYRVVEGNAFGTTSASVDGSNTNLIFPSAYGAGTSSPSGSFTHFRWDLLQYSRVQHLKMLMGQHLQYRDASSVFLASAHSGLVWFKNAPVTQIDLILGAGNFITGSVISLYGDI